MDANSFKIVENHRWQDVICRRSCPPRGGPIRSVFPIKLLKYETNTLNTEYCTQFSSCQHGQKPSEIALPRTKVTRPSHATLRSAVGDTPHLRQPLLLRLLHLTGWGCGTDHEDFNANLCGLLKKHYRMIGYTI